MTVTAVVLAAGLSTRMGTPKMLLRWRTTTVLGQVLRTLRAAGVEERLAVVGCERESAAEICAAEGARAVFNPAFDSGEMLSSLQLGLHSLAPGCAAALVVLGDQPFLEATVVQKIVWASPPSTAALVVPSYKRRRGHPWLVGANWWPEILQMRSPETPRDFLRRRESSIQYVELETDSILRDIDTPDEYTRSAP